MEALLAEELGQWCRYGTAVLDEPVIVAGEAQKCSYCTERVGQRLVQHCFIFLGIYCHTVDGDDMAQIGH
jgi:hypothetical protein